MGRVDGKVALITGAASGMGAAEARLFGREGAAVAVCDIQTERARAVAEEVTRAGGRARSYELDVRDEASWSAVTAQVVADFGGIDVLVNNAGIGIAPEDVAATALEDWDRVIAVNQTGSFLGYKHVIPRLRERGGGSIVQISSTFAVRGVPMLAAYTASKGAVAALMRHASVAYAQEGIRVNAVHPGIIDTPLLDLSQAGSTIAATPLGRAGRPEEIANVVLFLASDEASFVTGSSVYADGGYTAKGENT